MAIKFKVLTDALQAVKDQFTQPKDVPAEESAQQSDKPHGGWLEHKPDLPPGVVESTLSDNGVLIAASDPSLLGGLKDPDKPERCPEHVRNPQTNACISCLAPMEPHPMAGGEKLIGRFKVKLAAGASSGQPAEPKSPVSALMAALDSKDEAPPWEAPEGYTILDALKEHWGRSSKGEVLQLLNVKNGGTSWTVKSYNPETGRAVLEGQDKMVIRPVITEREVPLYTPFWR